MTTSGEDEKPHSVALPPKPARALSNLSAARLRRRRRRPHGLNDVTKVVLKMNSRRNLSEDGGSQESELEDGRESLHSGLGSLHSPQSPGHRRVFSSSAVPYQDHHHHENANATIPLFGGAKSPTSTFLDHAAHLENLFQMGPTDSFSDLPHLRRMGSQPSIQEGENEEEEEEEDELVIRWSRRSGPKKATDVEQGNGGPQPPAQETDQLLPPPRQPPKPPNRCWAAFRSIIPPGEITTNLRHFLSTTVLLFIVPCTFAAAVLFYHLGNPDLDFLPLETRLSWFFLFFVRQSVTFTLARMSQWILQILTVRTTLFVRTAGPLLALIAMQSVGWPFLVTAWGIWNLFLLHGDTPFVKHWLYWSGIQLFSIHADSKSDSILNSELYGRILAAMILLGVATGTKRTFVALYMSRRMLQYYRAQLEDVMSKVKLIMEIAELAAQTDMPEFDQLVKENFTQVVRERNFSQIARERKMSSLVEKVPTFEKTKKDSREKLTSVVYEQEGHDDDSVLGAEQNLDDAMEDWTDAPTDPKEVWTMLKARALSDRDIVNFAGHDTKKHKKGPQMGKGHSLAAADSSLTDISLIFPFLQRWHEPDDKGKKAAAPTPHDILQFKKAMSFMEQPYPFGLAYGSCANRKACVKNAIRLYRKLLKFTPDQKMLSFDVIGALAYEEDGQIDEEDAIDMLRLFFPDKDDLLPMLAFVQACDYVYKRMRFLRASLINSTKIDAVIEDIFDFLFYLLLAVALVSIIGFNPWPLLVSMSTLAVSFAFAFGPAVAKNVEGIVMIAVRRPFDIGDRITLCGAQVVSNPVGSDSWIVEDITLTTTTLRYVTTNEVATVNNSSIADARIVNLARSPKALVSIVLRFNVDSTQKQLDDFRSAMEAYMENRPRTWIGLVHCRPEGIDTDEGYLNCLFRCQHVKPWQEFGSIMMDKGEWERHGQSVATEMGIIFESPPRQMTVGLGLARSLRRNKAAADRQQVADFFRSINSDSGVPGKASPAEQIFGPIAEFFDLGEPESQTDASEVPEMGGNKED